MAGLWLYFGPNFGVLRGLSQVIKVYALGLRGFASGSQAGEKAFPSFSGTRLSV